jgi:hypothetical protein
VLCWDVRDWRVDWDWARVCKIWSMGIVFLFMTLDGLRIASMGFRRHAEDVHVCSISFIRLEDDTDAYPPQDDCRHGLKSPP